MDYNTKRKKMPLPEYGRNIQLLVDHLLTIKDREERTNAAIVVSEIMAQQNPQIRNHLESQQQLWDHLHIMAEYQLSVDVEFKKPPRPEPELIKEKKLDYPKKALKYRFYGNNVELLINQCISMQDGSEKDKLVGVIAAYMRMCYRLWNDDKVSDELIIKHLKQLSGYQIIAESIPNIPMPIDKTPQKEIKRGKPKPYKNKRKRNF